nr:MAG TPA: hypothetical protein [Caudoviricetes sp.]
MVLLFFSFFLLKNKKKDLNKKLIRFLHLD